eukprot:UN33536
MTVYNILEWLKKYCRKSSKPIANKLYRLQTLFESLQEMNKLLLAKNRQLTGVMHDVFDDVDFDKRKLNDICDTRVEALQCFTQNLVQLMNKFTVIMNEQQIIVKKTLTGKGIEKERLVNKQERSLLDENLQLKKKLLEALAQNVKEKEINERQKFTIEKLKDKIQKMKHAEPKPPP